MKSTDMPDMAGLRDTVSELQKGVGPAAKKPNRKRFPYEQSWPADVWSIGLDRLDLLGVDESGDLYWDGKRVEVRRPLSLTFWQRVGAVVLAIAAVIGAIAAAVSAYAALMSIPAH